MTVDPAVIRRLVTWGPSRADIRALLLYSSRVDPGAQIDPFSDYDVLCIVDDIRTVGIFRDAPTEVAAGLGLQHPQELRERMATHLGRVRRLGRAASGPPPGVGSEETR
jgi:hypothetical protein